MTKKYNIVDFLRGWSIFTIALMHLVMSSVSGILLKASAFGGAGVHVFILCSGFGLYLSYLRKPLRYADFLKRRFGKVWIPYAIAVLLWGAWFAFTKGFFPTREVVSHLLLYKMFSSDLDVSLCYPYWFISTIIQFYLFWPLIVKLFRLNGGGYFMLFISLTWSTVVGLLGLEDERPWGSFFLQYLWEFGLGMWIAERSFEDESAKMMNITNYKWWWLITASACGMAASAFMAWNGGILKLYNDIPSLIGYLSVALIIYKVGLTMFNRFFEWANSYSYEFYLVHKLVYVIMAYMLKTHLPVMVLLTISFVSAYISGYGYRILLKKTRLVR